MSFPLASLVATHYQFRPDFENCTIGAVELVRMRSPFYQGERWALRRGSSCLNVQGEWEYEVQPSSRDDDFYKRCRFSTPELALIALEKSRQSGKGAR